MIARAGLVHLDDGEAEPVDVGDLLQAGIVEVAARQLRGAFGEVADAEAASDLVPVAVRPAELVHHRREELLGVAGALA